VTLQHPSEPEVQLAARDFEERLLESLGSLVTPSMPNEMYADAAKPYKRFLERVRTGLRHLVDAPAELRRPSFYLTQLAGPDTFNFRLGPKKST
jgi:hypothetical protein